MAEEKAEKDFGGEMTGEKAATILAAIYEKIGGYDVRSDQVQTLVYMCLTGTAITDIAKQAGIKIGEKMLIAAVKKIPGNVLIKINQRIGFRLLTKFGEKGVINLGKMVPLAGGVIGGAFDVATTSAIAKNAVKMFISGDDECDTTTEAEVEELVEIIEEKAEAPDGENPAENVEKN